MSGAGSARVAGSREPEVDAVVIGIGSAAETCARLGSSIAKAAALADAVARDLRAGWSGRAGEAAWEGAAELYEELSRLASYLFFLADILRVEGGSLSRALAAGGEAIEVRDSDRIVTRRLEELLRVLSEPADPRPWERARVGPGLGPMAGRFGASGPLPENPREVPAWWHSLGPAERARLASQRPDLGGVDGLPAVVRDGINRQQLGRLVDAGVASAAHLAISQHLADSAGSLLVDLEEDGRAVVADGDPDTAGRVVTFVPGTGSGSESVGETASRAAAVCDAAQQIDSVGCVAVSWLDFAAPQDVPHAAVDSATAQEAAPRLRAFLAGADAAGDALGRTSSDRDVIGYSYGSVVVGSAAAGAQGLAADTMLHVGSPGTGADSLAEQRVDVDGVPRAAQREDIVGVRSRFDPVPLWSYSGVHGAAPDDAGFGGRAVDVTAETPRSLDALTQVHSHYFDRGTASLAEIGRLIAER